MVPTGESELTVVLIPRCFPLFFTPSKVKEESFHVTWSIHTAGTSCTKSSHIISAKQPSSWAILPVVVLSLAFTVCFDFASPHAVQNRCASAKSFPSPYLAGNHSTGHDYFVEVAFLSYCILSCHCSSCQKAGVAGKDLSVILFYFFFNKDSLKRIVECVLNHLILPPLCQIL